MTTDSFLEIIDRRLRHARREVARRQELGLQFRPWQHRVVELEELRSEVWARMHPSPPRKASSSSRTARGRGSAAS